MRDTINLLLLSVRDWRRSLLLVSAALSRPGYEIFFVDPEKAVDEIAALKLLASRLPLQLLDATGDAAFSEVLRADAGVNKHASAFTAAGDVGELLARFGPPPGLVCAPASDAARCIKGAVLAVRLGYLFLPCSGAGCRDLLLAAGFKPGALPIVWLGQGEPPAELAPATVFNEVAFLPDDLALVQFMLRRGLELDYLLVYNSADLNKESVSPRFPGEAWVRGLSLLAPLIASYRPAFPHDAAAEEPDPVAIEGRLNRFVAGAGLRPRFMALLASPGAIPLVYEPLRTIGSTAEVMARDIHLRLNDDLFFDAAEGRLFQSSPGGLSAQILTTKYYHRLPGRQKERRRVLVAASPEVEHKIIFNSDDPLLETQFAPLLEACGYGVTVLQGKEASAERVAAALPESDFFLYAGHGTTEALKTCGRFLTRRDLPPLPPLVAYASACTTVGMEPYWTSASDGLDWEAIPVPYRDQFGLAMVEKGAVCYVGGLTSEDLQFATSIYPLFFEALLVKGMSVGEAVRETRNFVSLYASILQQKAPERYACYKWWTAATLQQQTLFGDPALVPAPRREAAGTSLPRRVESLGEAGNRFRLSVTIPEERWRRACRPVHPGKATQQYYRTRSVEVITPYGEDVVSWGDFYRLAPDAEDSAERGVMSSYLHLYLDLPPRLMPVRLDLADAREAGCECLLCGRETEPPGEILALFQDFRIPFIMMPAARFDYRDGWAFAVEERDESHRVHWLVPLLVIDEASRSAVRAGELVFELQAAPAQILSGRVEYGEPLGGSSYLISAGSASRPADPGQGGAGEGLSVMVQAITRPGGFFKIKCAAAADAVAVEEQFPLYDILEPYRTLQKELHPLALPGPVLVHPRVPRTGRLYGRVLDAATAAPLPGALVRAWRGVSDPSGDLMIEGFAGEARAAADGSFVLDLPAGKYQLYAVARAGGLNYKSKDFAVEIAAGEEHYQILPLNGGARVSGRIRFAGEPPLHPVDISLKRYRDGAPGETLAAVPAARDGAFACLVEARARFCVLIREEGWKEIEDNNSGRGYMLQPGEELVLSYTLEPLGD